MDVFQPPLLYAVAPLAVASLFWTALQLFRQVYAAVAWVLITIMFNTMYEVLWLSTSHPLFMGVASRLLQQGLYIVTTKAVPVVLVATNIIADTIATLRQFEVAAQIYPLLTLFALATGVCVVKTIAHAAMRWSSRPA